MADISYLFDNIKFKQKIIQAMLSKHRLWAIQRYKYILPIRFIENRYQKTEHRNKNEIDRVWDHKLKNIIEEIENNSKEHPFLKNVLVELIKNRYKSLKAYRNISKYQLDIFIEEHFSVNKQKQDLEDKLAENKLERAHEFMSMMYEMLDDSEQS